MALTSWLTNTILPKRRREPASLPGVLTQSELRLIVERERARADRTQSSLSLVLIELHDAQLRTSLPMHFPVAIARRLRCTDAVGWFDGETLGLLLPDTQETGATTLSNELRQTLGTATIGANWRILSYPEDMPAQKGNREAAGSGARRVAAHSGNGEAREAVGFAQVNGASAMGTGNDGPVIVTPRPTSTKGPLRVTLPTKVEPLRSVFATRTSRAKRALDILGAVVGLIALAPVMASAAVAVKVSSPGPVFFSQQRAGEMGRPFAFYKFRTMAVDAEQRKPELLALNEQSGPVFKIAHDPRVTPVGRILRKASIDELPQLWNVLIGDMSIVGPRPPISAEVAEYKPWQRRRLEIRGGLTCIWQVSGRSAIKFDDWVRLDLRYAKNNSFRQDLMILLKTIPAVLTGRGAH